MGMRDGVIDGKALLRILHFDDPVYVDRVFKPICNAATDNGH